MADGGGGQTKLTLLSQLATPRMSAVGEKAILDTESPGGWTSSMSFCTGRKLLIILRDGGDGDEPATGEGGLVIARVRVSSVVTEKQSLRRA